MIIQFKHCYCIWNMRFKRIYLLHRLLLTLDTLCIFHSRLCCWKVLFTIHLHRTDPNEMFVRVFYLYEQQQKRRKKNTWKPIYLKDIVSQKHKQRHIHKHIHITHFAVCKTYIILILTSFFNYNYWIKWISCLGFFIDWNIFAYMPLLCYSIQHADIVHSSVCICRRRK